MKNNQLLGIIFILLIILGIRLFIALVPQKPLPPSQPEQTSDTLRNTQHSPAEPLLFPFNPNTADSGTLAQLGLNNRQIRNIINYRNKGGRFKQPDDLRKLYTINDSTFQTLQPYIRIDSTPFQLAKLKYLQDSLYRDSLKQQYRLKRLNDSLYWDSIRKLNKYIKKDTIIELNNTDTTQLQYIKGIGSHLARKIIQYRQQLRGYHSTQQLSEIPHIPQETLDSILPHLTANPDSVQPIPVNHASIRQLQQHPYISFNQAKEIYERRRMKIKLKNWNDLQNIPSLSQKDIDKIKPYLSFTP